ncbi:hypothetical protein [Chromohalobacter sp. 296-RDG]|uniref:hypothetical protein n=1 Tax=Chromohalobacter sp. 296-RDG TaxID=2994062 RepID=UPI0024690066|nr:hypothetical protein [Chromohalobacter sp. 296-RDG]
MGMIPGYCKDCGARFVSSAVSVDETSRVIVESTHVSCPNSPQHRAYLLDGVFTGAGELVRLLSGPDSSGEVLEQIAQLIREARAQGRSLDDTAEKAENLYPGIGSILKRFQNLGFAMAVVIAMNPQVNLNFNVDIDVNRLVEQAVGIWCKQESPEEVTEKERSSGESD